MAMQKTSKLFKSLEVLFALSLAFCYNRSAIKIKQKGGLKMYRTATSKAVSQGYEVYITLATSIKTKKILKTEAVYVLFSLAFYHLCFILSKAI